MKSNKLNIFICLSCGAVIFFFIFFSTGFDTLKEHFHSLKLWWIAAALGCMIVYWFLDSLVLHSMIKPMHKKQRFISSFRTAMGAQYFNSITPFSTGGQPFQAYYLTKQGISLGVVINSLLSKFIIYQTALVLVSAGLLAFRLGYFKSQISNFTFVVVVGFLINLAVLVFLISCALFKNATRKMAGLLIRFLAKIRLIKNPEEITAYVDKELDKFSVCFGQMMTNIPIMILAVFLSIAQIVAYLSVPYMIYKAFGLYEIDFVTIIAAQSFVMMVSSFVPIPGAGVGAEGFFYFFFKQFFTQKGQLGVALVLWRLITFYITLVVGAVFALNSSKGEPIIKDKLENEKNDTQQTKKL